MKRFMSTLIDGVSGRRSAWLVCALILAASIGIIVGSGTPSVSNNLTSGLPASSQSAVVARLQHHLPSGQIAPALIVYSRDGARLTLADRAAIEGQSSRLRSIALGHQISPLVLAPDGSTALLSVSLSANVDSARTDRAVKSIRGIARARLPHGLVAQVTGAAGFTADIDNAFSGANVTLLLVTVIVVALLLLATYRSPLLWMIPLVVVGLADQVANGIIAVVSRHTSLAFNQATTGIVDVLVFGAGTDYALLLIARYREELRREQDRHRAMARALRAAGPAIAASGLTVILALLTLLAAVLGGDKALGVGGAIGIATALVFGLVALPAALVIAPRGIFWPLTPRVEGEPGRASAQTGRIWRRIGEATAQRPWPVIAASLVLLAVLATGLRGVQLGLSQAQTFRTTAESVTGLATLARAFPAGEADPVVIVTHPRQVDMVRRAARRTPGVASAELGDRSGSIATVNVVLTAPPDTEASYHAIMALRTAVAVVPGAEASVGGTVATDLDTRTAGRHDLALIAPLILLVVFVVLVVLLRAVVAPLVLLATVIVSFFAALGAANWALTHLFGIAGIDNQAPLLSFLFLVALGVDYNIFLVTRTKEEAATVGTSQGIVNALAVTGGVITSAGILLAAVFAVLGVLPVIVLTEIGIIVGVGVLLDTLLVRTVLVPAIVHVLGERFWSPGRAPAGARPFAPIDTRPVAEHGVH